MKGTIKHPNRFILIILGIGLVALLGFYFILYRNVSTLRSWESTTQYEQQGTPYAEFGEEMIPDGTILYDFETVTNDGKVIIISGWVLNVGAPTYNRQLERPETKDILLYNQASDMFYHLPIQSVWRSDISARINGQNATYIDYNYAGFYASARLGDLAGSLGEWEIVILYDTGHGSTLVYTGVYANQEVPGA